MATLKRLRLRNFAQHVDCNLELGPGLTVITGPMGSGKTNLGQAVFASLSNDFSNFGSTKKELIRRGSSGDSFIATVWIADDGTEVEVIRYLKGGSSKLILNGEAQIERRESDITKKLEELLGFERQSLIGNHCVRQSRIDSVISDLPSDRVRAMANLFYLQDVLLPDMTQYQQELVWVAGRLSGVDSEAVQRAKDERIAAATAYLEMIRDRAEAMTSVPSDEDYERAKSLVYEKNRRADLIAKRQILTRNIQRRKETILQTAKALQNAQVALLRAEDVVKEVQQELSSIQPAILAIKMRRQHIKRIKELENDKISVEFDLLDSPVQPSKSQLSTKAIEQLRNQLSDAQRALRLIREGKSVCDKCGAEIPFKPSDVEKYEAESRRLESRIREATEIADQWAKYYKEDAAWPRKQAALSEKLRAIVDELNENKKELAAIPEPSGSEEHLLEKQSALEKRLRALNSQQKTAQENVIELSSKCSALRESQKKDKERLGEIRDELKKIPRQDDPEFVKAEALIRERELSDQKLSDLERQRLVLLYRSRKAREEYSRSSEAASQAEALELWKKHLEEAVLAFRPSNMPKAVLASLLESLSAPISRMCQHLGLPFSISTSPDLELLANHPDGSIEPATCLSGGQKACVSIAFWASKLLTIQSGVQTIFLDEPTANLDEEAVSQFGRLLIELAKLIQSKGRQVIISTHHRQLDTCAHYRLSFYDKESHVS